MRAGWDINDDTDGNIDDFIYEDISNNIDGNFDGNLDENIDGNNTELRHLKGPKKDQTLSEIIGTLRRYKKIKQMFPAQAGNICTSSFLDPHWPSGPLSSDHVSISIPKRKLLGTSNW